MPELAVLLCARDAAATVGRAVTSTLRALPRDAELRVLDDGSRDATTDVVASIADPRIRLARAASGIGYASARQRLLDESDSEVVAIMDADDVTLPWRFQVQARELGRADVLFSPIVSFGRRLRDFRPSLPVPVTTATSPLLLMLGGLFSHPTMYARRSALTAVGGYRPGAVAEDYDLQLRLAADGRMIRRGAVPVLAYRRHPAQTSTNAAFHRRADEAGLVAEARLALFERTFDWQGAGAPDATEQWAIVRREVVARRLGPLQATLVRRFARVRLGPPSDARRPSVQPPER
jgi:glycosyltransferase involved in cell wall biosynthesis